MADKQGPVSCVPSKGGSLHSLSPASTNGDLTMSLSPGDTASSIAAIRELHRKRREALLQRQPEPFAACYWEDSVLFIFDHRMTFDQLRRRLPLLAAGSEAITVEIPPLDEILVSETADAATTSFQWKTRIRNSEGTVFDRVHYETDVWYRRNGIWKIICMHLTNLTSDQVS
jgi:ketosteroid isomerase-like protein